MVQQMFAPNGSGRHQERQGWLVYGTRDTEDIYYRDEFEKVAAEHPNFHYVVTLSRAPDDWSGRRGHVQEYVRQIAAGRSDLHAYICGLNQMVSSVRKMLTEECGWEKKHVIYERYD